ncbi:MAG: tetratricopeptide repeat protein [Bacteroidales bacterium]|nr:tetratricopeptide repeat protein [Bacteroidales bacterium]
MSKYKTKKAIGAALMAAMLLLPMAVVAQRETGDERTTGLFRHAMDLYQKQKYAAAQQIFDQVAALGATADGQWLTVSDACYYAGVCSEKLDNDDAYYRLEEFLRLYPQSARQEMARFYLGNFYYARGDYERALEYYKTVDAKEVEYDHRSEYNFKKGYCYFQKGDTKKASELFAQQVGGKSKYSTSSLYYYAHIQYMDGQYDLALKNFRELQGDKKFAKIAPSYIARIYYYLGKDDELLRMAPELLKDKDAFKRSEIEQMVGEVYFNRGEYKLALEHYAAARREQKQEQQTSCTPQDNDYQVGYCHYMLGRYDSAAVYLSRKMQCSDSVAQNALYTLGDCYVRMGRKMDARSVFQMASKMDYNKQIKEDALFNYAKLSCELNQDAMGGSIKSFEDYLKKYPKGRHKTEAEEILTELYCSTNNYKEAIRLLEQVPQRNAALEQAYQRALLNRGIELCNSGKEEDGVKMYEKAVKVNAVPRITADANYLVGEWQYRNGQISAAEKSLNKLLLSSYGSTSAYANQARYTYAYVLMRQKRYDEALETLRELDKRIAKAEDKTSVMMRNDIHNRMGDCLYVNSRFAESIVQYDKVIDAKGKDADYATYQKALAYGAQGKNSDKLTYLNYIFERYDNSPLKSKAMLEIANTYMMCDNNEMAMTYYNNFIKQYPQRVYVKTALLNQGLIYYNTERADKALETFDRLLTQYPGTDEARDALGTVKNIYIEQNRVDEYFSYVKRTTKVTVSTVEQDSITFLAVEGRYQEGDFENAAAGLENYLNKFPNGLFTVKAHYLLADSYFRQGQNEKALPHYVAVASTGTNQYSERSLYNAANIAYSLGDYNQAATLYQRLMENAESDNSLLQGEIGGLRCAVALKSHSGVMEAGQRLVNERKATTELKEEAWLAMARSCFNNGDADGAYANYGNLTRSANGEYNGEARCRQAEILIQSGKLKQAEKMIESIVSDASSDYWLAYSFILWADVYYANGNTIQAKQTLQSVMDNYDGEDLVGVARGKYEAIVAAEQPAVQPEEEEIVIEL